MAAALDLRDGRGGGHRAGDVRFWSLSRPAGQAKWNPAGMFRSHDNTVQTAVLEYRYAGPVARLLLRSPLQARLRSLPGA